MEDGRLPRRRRARPDRGQAAPLPCAHDHPRHRRLRPRLLLLHLGALLHRRRQCHGAARRPAAAGHGVRAVPSDRHLRRRLPDHRRRARRGRLPDQFQGRALHGALRAQRQGPGLARCRQPRHDHRDPRGPRRRRRARPHPPAPGAPGAGGHPRAPARHRRDRAHFRRRRCHEGADPGAAHGALQHGRHSLQLPRRGRRPEAGDPERSCRGSWRSARRPASRCMGPTASARTRCWTWWSSAARRRAAARELVKPGSAPQAAARRCRRTSRCRAWTGCATPTARGHGRDPPRDAEDHAAGCGGVSHRRDASHEGTASSSARPSSPSRT